MKLEPILIALLLRGGRSALSSSSSEPESGALLRGHAGRPFVIDGASCADRCGRLQSNLVELVECLEGCGRGRGSDDGIDVGAEAGAIESEAASVSAHKPPPGAQGKGGIGKRGKGRRSASDSEEGPPPDNGGIVNEHALCVRKCDDAGGRTARRVTCIAKCDAPPEDGGGLSRGKDGRSEGLPPNGGIVNEHAKCAEGCEAKRTPEKRKDCVRECDSSRGGTDGGRSKGRDGRSEGPPSDGGIVNDHAQCVDECDAAGGSFGKRKGCLRRCDADEAAAEAEAAKDSRSDGPPPNGGVVNEHADCVEGCDRESAPRKRNRCVARCDSSQGADVDDGLDEVRTAA
ncbi:hypothetical protein ACHAWF_018219 [Thalassiosira exigua]